MAEAGRKVMKLLEFLTLLQLQRRRQLMPWGWAPRPCSLSQLLHNVLACSKVLHPKVFRANLCPQLWLTPRLCPQAPALEGALFLSTYASLS